LKKQNKTKNNLLRSSLILSVLYFSEEKGTYKLYIEWQHFSNEKYRVITKTKGRGVRQIDYNADEDLTVEKITERGTKLICPPGKKSVS
jgi:hypothetical protein